MDAFVRELCAMGISMKASRFIKRKIRILNREGYKGKQAVAIAFNMAREKGYKVPRVK